MTTDDPDDKATSSLACHLLCAVPQLVDPNFVRSVVLIIDHSPQGAFGLILNQALSTTLVSEFAEALTLSWEGPADQTLQLGGPVEPQRAFLLHDHEGWDPLAEPFAPGVFLTTSLEGVRQTSESRFGAPGRHFMVLLGYAGWGAGQIESEMAQGSWMAVPLCTRGGVGVSPSWIWTASQGSMWNEALASLGIDPAWLIGASVGAGRTHRA